VNDETTNEQQGAADGPKGTIAIPMPTYAAVEKVARGLCGITPAMLIDWTAAMAVAHAMARVKQSGIDTGAGAKRQTIGRGYTVTKDNITVAISGVTHRKLKRAAEILGLTMPTLVLDMWRVCEPTFRDLPSMSHATSRCTNLRMAITATIDAQAHVEEPAPGEAQALGEGRAPDAP